MAGESDTLSPFQEKALAFDNWFPSAPPTAKPAPPPSPEDILLDFDSWHARQPPAIKSRIDTHLKASGPNAAKQKDYLGATAMVAGSPEWTCMRWARIGPWSGAATPRSGGAPMPRRA